MKKLVIFAFAVLVMAACTDKKEKVLEQSNEQSQNISDDKQDSISQEQAVRDAMGEYLVNEIGKHYQQGEVCVPTLMIVATEESDSTKAQVWCDCWIDWYRVAGDTLKTVSGGNHSGCMTLQLKDGKPVVTAFEQTLDGNRYLPSAKRIFGKHYDVYEGMHSKQDVREAARKEQLREYVLRHKLNIRYYQDYGWDAVEL